MAFRATQFALCAAFLVACGGVANKSASDTQPAPSGPSSTPTPTASATETSTETATATATATNTATDTETAVALIATYCSGCHGTLPAQCAEQVNSAVQGGIMPPGGGL